MKAAILKQTGDITDLEKNLIIADIPVPKINPDEVLINIKYASLNHRDLWITKGQYGKIVLPAVLGSDGAGIIQEKGTNVSDFNIGDEVVVNPGLNWGKDENFQSKDFKILGMPDNGTFAEFLKIDKSYLYHKPSYLDLSQAAALPLAGLTAFRALFKKAVISEKDCLLITGIGGGVSTVALAFSLKTCAEIYVTSGDDSKIEKAISLGAKSGANYNNDQWHKELIREAGDKINLVLDSAGGETLAKCMDIINYGGTIVSYGATCGNTPQFSGSKLYWKQLKILGSTMGSTNDFTEMIEFVNTHSVFPVIDQVIELENIYEAFRIMNDGVQFGKIIIKV